MATLLERARTGATKIFSKFTEWGVAATYTRTAAAASHSTTSASAPQTSTASVTVIMVDMNKGEVDDGSFKEGDSWGFVENADLTALDATGNELSDRDYLTVTATSKRWDVRNVKRVPNEDAPAVYMFQLRAHER